MHVRADMADSLVFDTGATHDFAKDLSMLHDKRNTHSELQQGCNCRRTAFVAAEISNQTHARC